MREFGAGGGRAAQRERGNVNVMRHYLKREKKKEEKTEALRTKEKAGEGWLWEENSEWNRAGERWKGEWNKLNGNWVSDQREQNEG